jgi:hypothetical protein
MLIQSFCCDFDFSVLGPCRDSRSYLYLFGIILFNGHSHTHIRSQQGFGQSWCSTGIDKEIIVIHVFPYSKKESMAWMG